MIITSRVGRKPVVIPTGVVIKMTDRNLEIKGPKGQMSIAVHPHVRINIEDANLTICKNEIKDYVRSGSGGKLTKSIAGTMRSRIYSIVEGVSKGYERKLTLIGVGYRAASAGKVLNLTLGFSHPVVFSIPEGIVIETPSQTEVIIKGIDKHLVGQTAAKIRAIRPPEPYKGKGVRYSDEKIELKETKKK